MTVRLHVLLGAGGVGKTTLAAGHALALARDGARVGLLGVDPSHRLAEALGVALADLDAPVPGAGALRAAIVQPHQAILRWVAETMPDPAAAERLAHNPFFAALGDRLATATDILAAARIAEWIERDPALTELVVDTAPGVAALDFLRSPRRLDALVQGRMIRWLRAAARDTRLGGGARRLLAGLAGIGGTGLVRDLAEFFALVQAPLERMIERVDRARRLLASHATELLLVTSPLDTGAAGAAQIHAALAAEHLAPHAVIVNRTWPREVARELDTAAVPPPAFPLVEYTRAYLEAQARVVSAVATWAPVITVASRPALTQVRRDALVELGATLAHSLAAIEWRRAS
jgi:anion-transporting  ArsA/GET3 family ATPase